MLKIKRIEVSIDGTNFVWAEPFDNQDRQDLAVNDPNVDSYFPSPKYDLSANGFKLYPAFTAAEVAAGAKIYVEWYRAPRDFATTGTDDYEPGFDLQFHELPFLGASYEYCKINKPDMAKILEVDLFGNGSTKKGLLNDLKHWYSRKQPSLNSISGEYINSI